MSELLQIQELSVRYHTTRGSVLALNSVGLGIGQGEFLALVGESGCGKTTLGLALIGLLPPKYATVERGSIVFKGTDLTHLKAAEMRRYRGSEIGMIFQEPLTSLNPLRRVGEQIAEAVVLRNQKKGGGETFGMSRIPGRKWKFPPELRSKVEEMLNLVRIADAGHIVDRYPFELSGGMRQRVMIAMALAQEPSLLIADEPTTALDVTTQAQVLKLMREIRDKLGTTIVLVTHDLAVASQVADRVVVMYAGEVVEDAEVHDIFQKPLHPYTMGLLACIPTGGHRLKLLSPIKGTIPDIGSISPSCKFTPRCPYAMDVCSRQVPRLLEVEKGHRVACFLHDK